MAKRRKKGRHVPYGIAYIHATFNNTIVSITDLEGNVLCWASGGTVGFSGTKKGTPYAAQKTATAAAKKAQEQFGMRKIAVFVKGPGPGRETAIRALQSAGLHVVLLRDVTPIPHNGCRPPRRRRV